MKIYQRFLLATAPGSRAADTSNLPGVDLTVQSLFGIIAGLACWISRLALIAMVVAIVIYGIQFMISQDNSTKFGKARTNLMWALVGVLVILGTYTIIATVANSVASLDPNDPEGRSQRYTNFVPLRCGN
ncbi:MAG: hypothetical protein A3C88_00525 [Candidatus Yanofskybacteria bacterium RIFCSPHIGHO2_02_FULL_50_12]|uniref:Uncharacterized protein n=1 Tax=Candidatus Yanofskybacteria bacterium RIFCSPHIGHO2_02_FULL_50_12 TaxID=1802685 RepID=A0A1F8FUR6_9BACT|nr:MAG: hypothetical protein A3C88_00525 [Candidatus Yanofskybacteria bacterium RIFCSPHIGHO2_02_FULL_50_12]